MERNQVIRGVIFSLLINGGLPLLVYLLLLGHMSNVMALTIATLIPLIETVIHFLKYKKWDVFAGFMLVGFTLGIIAALIGGDERLILIRESFVTGILGFIFLGSLVTRRPLIYYFAMRFTVGKTQEEQAAFADNWNVAYVRKVLRILTAGWGIVLLGEALLKIVLVYSLSISTFLAISSLVTYGFIGLAISWTVVYRRKSSKKLAQLKENINSSDEKILPLNSEHVRIVRGKAMSEIKLSFKTFEGESQFKDAYHHNLKFWTVPYESFYVHSEFGYTHIISSGPEDAPPLVLLHGFGFSSLMWYPNIEALSSQYRVYALDVLSDINKSVPTKPFQDKRDCAIWLCSVLDGIGIEKATLIGHSAGGWQAINFVNYAPDRIKELILLAPAASFVPFHKQFYLRQFTVALIRTRTVVIRFFCKWFVAKGNVVNEGLYEQFFTGIKNFKWSKVIFPTVFTDEELRKIQAPTLLLIGDREVIYNPLSAMHRAKQLLPQLTTEIVPHAGHFLSAEQANFVNKSILDFLKKQHN